VAYRVALDSTGTRGLKWDVRSHERHRHHDPGGALTYCVYKHLGDGQEADATDAQTGGSHGQG